MEGKDVRNIKGELWGWYSVVGSAAACQSEDTRKAAYIVGDILWVRENFYVQPELWARNHDEQPVHYAADTKREEVEDYVQKPSIHMPRWASRIFLEALDVRVERIQDISEADCRAEGVTDEWIAEYKVPTAKDVFRMRWNELNEDRHYGWDKNPYIWCYTFKEITDEVRRMS